MEYNLELIKLTISDSDTWSASEAATSYCNRLIMHRRNSNFQEEVKPQDYRDAYELLYDAWGEAEEAFPDDINLAKFLQSPAADRKADLNSFDAETRTQAEALRKIDAAWAELVKVSAGYGITAPAEWAHK